MDQTVDESKNGQAADGPAENYERNQYRRGARVQMDDRNLLLRGGIYDGRRWTGVVAVGKRVFCGGDATWSAEGVYLVTTEVVTAENGDEVSVAVPAFA